MMHRTITHGLRRMHNSYVCHELWTGASAGFTTRNRAVLFHAERIEAEPLHPCHTRHTPRLLSWDIFVRSSRDFAGEITAGLLQVTINARGAYGPLSSPTCGLALRRLNFLFLSRIQIFCLVIVASRRETNSRVCNFRFNTSRHAKYFFI